MTTKFCVVGSPIAHSLSPVLHQAAYQELGLDFSYEAVEVAKGQLMEFLSSHDYQGVSVTMPLKSEAFDLSTEATRSAVMTQAANTLCKSTDGWSCANTDVYGISEALSPVANPSRTAIIGSGATTLSALVALAEIFPDTVVTILARSDDAANEAVAFGTSLGLRVSKAEVSSESVSGADLVLSLVPAGSYPELWSEISRLEARPKGWLFDVSYTPWPSAPAGSWGTDKVIPGLEMLIWQAIEQIRIFSGSVGLEIDLDRTALYSVMRSAVSPK
jgi:shikimate dehydrogenase